MCGYDVDLLVCFTFCGFIDTATCSCRLRRCHRRRRCRFLSIKRCIIFIKDCHVQCFLIALSDGSSSSNSSSSNRFFSADIIFVLHFIFFVVICCYHGGNACPSSTSGSNAGSNRSSIIINGNSSWGGFDVVPVYLLFFLISTLIIIILFLLQALAACFPAADFIFGKWSSKGLDHGNKVQTRRNDRPDT